MIESFPPFQKNDKVAFMVTQNFEKGALQQHVCSKSAKYYRPLRNCKHWLNTEDFLGIEQGTHIQTVVNSQIL